jgi:D-arginine dehydrogenase
MTESEVIIIGGGIAGASLAYFLAPHARVTLLEAEAHAGMHSTGRSAAFFAETYGGPGVQPLTTASKPFLFSPPEAFADGPLVGPRGALHVARDVAALDALEADFAGSGVRVDRLGTAATAERAPMLAAPWCRRALWEPDCMDIDVARLHQGFLTGARRNGARLVHGARVEAIERVAGCWRASTRDAVFAAAIIVNAAGAWADAVAALAGVRPLGIQPLRRTVVVADLGAPPPADLPLVIDAAGTLYFKADAGQMWISPHDETPAPASDVQPEEIDVAVAIDRFETTTVARVRRVVRSWAGLRSFAPDRLPVYGFAPEAAGFFWCAGQGGFGIQTSPAAGAMAAALLLGTPTSPPGVDPERYSPRRFVD